MISKGKIALKEWAVTLNALDKGKQIILFRKGGIHEEGREFRIEHDKFFLYPTYEHQSEDLLKEEYRGDLSMVLNNREGSGTITIRNWAKISHVTEVKDSEEIKALSPYYIWTPNYLHERLNWRPMKPLYMLILKVYRLSQPKVIEIIPEYSGCKSWVNLDKELFLEESKPVLNDNNFNQIVEKIKGLLNRISKS